MHVVPGGDQHVEQPHGIDRAAGAGDRQHEVGSRGIAGMFFVGCHFTPTYKRGDAEASADNSARRSGRRRASARPALRPRGTRRRLPAGNCRRRVRVARQSLANARQHMAKVPAVDRAKRLPARLRELEHGHLSARLADAAPSRAVRGRCRSRSAGRRRRRRSENGRRPTAAAGRRPRET